MPYSIGLTALLVFVACNPDSGEPNNTPDQVPPEAADPGFKPLHRLNNTEYRNTLRDLLHTDHVLSVQFSEDPVTDGFDKSQIIQLGLFVGVNEAFTGNATVRVAVDQVTVTGVPGQADRTFTTGVDGLVINQYNVPPGTPAPVFHQ